ncbi:efflux RND transporter periplasmic adaptor subunit [Haematomicrobium sanguinis]|uniref:efflux RND transporter periplasmic adaptor subunit n=1 Tax=Haematomicrobium sanguinis TaxID=479106 RepID=UPI00047E5C82|nr:efflux RND transporter periplasmic adaptor subunit [Haematomicrobium sanguinis]
MFKKVIFPAFWAIAVIAIAAALLKLAFFGDDPSAQVQAQPQVGQAAAAIPVSRGDIKNEVTVKGTVQADPAVPVKSTAEGEVIYFYVAPGTQVQVGTPLFQVRKPVESPSGAGSEAGTEAGTEAGSEPTGPTFQYLDIYSTANGTVAPFDLLLGQTVSIGSDAMSINPGTFTASGQLTSDEQFRLFNKPTTATLTIRGGPAPFECKGVSIGEAKPSDKEAAPQPAGIEYGPSGPQPVDTAAVTGSVSCPIPAEAAVFAGLEAEIALTAGEAKNALLVPTTALLGGAGSAQIWVMDDGDTPQKREVTVGINNGEQAEITEGLSESDMVLQYAPGEPAQNDPNGQGMVYGG